MNSSGVKIKFKSGSKKKWEKHQKVLNTEAQKTLKNNWRIALVESSKTIGKTLFDILKFIMGKRILNRLNNLVGQYDGAENMSELYSGLKARIFDKSSKFLYVWCHGYRLNLIVLSAVGSCKEFVICLAIWKNYLFMTCSKSRSDIYRNMYKELYPKKTSMGNTKDWYNQIDVQLVCINSSFRNIRSYNKYVRGG